MTKRKQTRFVRFDNGEIGLAVIKSRTDNGRHVVNLTLRNPRNPAICLCSCEAAKYGRPCWALSRALRAAIRKYAREGR